MKNITITLDLCDTLVYGNTTFLFLDSYFKENGKYKVYKKIKNNILIRILFKILFKMRFDINRRVAVSFLKKIPRSQLSEYATRLVVNDTFRFNPEMLDVITFAKKNNIEVSIVSASLDFIVEAVAQQFEIKWFASNLAYSDGVCTGKISSDLLFSKHLIFKKIISEYKENKQSVFFVSDNIEDSNLLVQLENGFGFYTIKNHKKFEKKGIKKFSYETFISKLKDYE